MAESHKGTHVGFGRNIGSGSDEENQQKTDELGRYSDGGQVSKEEGRELFEKVIGHHSLIGPNGESPGEKYDSYRQGMETAFDGMANKCQPQFRKALNGMIDAMCPRIGVGSLDDGRCFYSPQQHAVFMSEKLMTQGSPYHPSSEVLEHELTHAMDAAAYYLSDLFFGNYGGNLSSEYPLESNGGKTLLQTAEEELGDLDEEFQKFVDSQSPYYEFDRRYDELNARKPSTEHTRQMVAKCIANVGGLEYFDVYDALSKMDIYDLEMFDLEKSDLSPAVYDFYPQLVPLRDALGKLKGSRYSGLIRDTFEMIDDWGKEYKRLVDGRNGVDFDDVLKLYKSFSTLNDIMSASNAIQAKRGRKHRYMGSGHSYEYFREDVNRATEIFAEIGPVLNYSPKAAEWLKAHAPKTVEGYYELLRFAAEVFGRNKG